MIQETAIDIVLDLARQNVIDDPELEDEMNEQLEAVEIVEKISNALYGGDMALFGSKKDEGCYTPEPLLKQLADASSDLKAAELKILVASRIIGKAYSDKYNLGCDKFVYSSNWEGNIELYKSGERLDDSWTLVKTIKVPDWAFDDPDKFIKEGL